jgi:hypothetical protein
MYAGYLAFGDVVVIDNHMTQSYAETLGIHWLRGCVECAGVQPRGRKYVTPLKDEGKPPWWKDTNKADSQSFLGLYGLAIDGADNSTREVDAIEGIADGGYVGARRNRMRTLTVKGVAVAETDTALGYGLGWLRSLDSDPAQRCTPATVRLYDSCPCVCGPGCDDPACQQSCVIPYQRQLGKCRILSGPTVLTRRMMPSGGAMAEVEFQIIAQDPRFYTHPQPFVSTTGTAVPVTDMLLPAPPPPGTPTDPWVPAPRSQGWEPEPVRTEWIRSEQDAPLPDVFSGEFLAPEVIVGAPHGDVGEVRVTLWDGPIERAAFIIPGIPANASVRVSLLERRVFTEWGGVERSNSAYIAGPNGGPFFWPDAIPATDLLLTVDRPPMDPPVIVSVSMVGTDAG